MVISSPDLDSQFENNIKPFVAVWMVAYNHESYIAQAIDSIVAQQTNFDFKIFIGEDCSTDATRKICQEYKKKYPDKIELILHEKNLGANANGIFMYKYCFKSGAKYIALCEGDDYWTDSLKLQKQVDFLEANLEYELCTHNVEEKNEVTGLSHFFPNVNENTEKQIEDYILNNLTATCSLLFKAAHLEPIPEWYHKIEFGDLGLMLFIFYRSNKKMIILKDTMAVYRVNSESIHGALKNDNNTLIKAYKMHLSFINTIDKKLFLKNKFQQSVLTKKINTHSILINLYKNKSVVNYYKHWFIKQLLIRFRSMSK